jgi:hypothetical protein
MRIFERCTIFYKDRSPNIIFSTNKAQIDKLENRGERFEMIVKEPSNLFLQ